MDIEIDDEIITNLVPAREAVVAMQKARSFSRDKFKHLLLTLSFDILEKARQGESEHQFRTEKQYGYKLYELIQKNARYSFYQITCDKYQRVSESDPGHTPCNFTISWNANG